MVHVFLRHLMGIFNIQRPGKFQLRLLYLLQVSGRCCKPCFLSFITFLFLIRFQVSIGPDSVLLPSHVFYLFPHLHVGIIFRH